MKNDKVTVANKVLECFAPGTSLRLESGYVLVRWEGTNSYTERRWMTRGGSFYPVWYGKWGHGGTACTALAQLVRWIQGKPVLPLITWRYWASEAVQLLRHGDFSSLQKEMMALGYPEVATCVLCQQEIIRGMDWWSLDGVSGPCCTHNYGCRQRGAS